MSTPTLAARAGLSRKALNARPHGLRTIHHTSAGRHHEERQTEVVVVAAVGQIDPEDDDIAARDPDPSRSFGHARLVVQHEVHEQVERQRHERQPRALHPQCRKSDEHAQHHARQSGDRDREQEREVRQGHGGAADDDLATGVEEHGDIGADPQERRLGQGDLAGESVGQVRPDAHHAEDREQSHVEQGRVRPPDREHDEEGEASGERRPFDGHAGPRLDRDQQVEHDDSDERHHPEPDDPVELRVSEGQQHDQRGGDDRRRGESPRHRAALRPGDGGSVIGEVWIFGGDGAHIVRSSAMPKRPCGRHRMTRIINNSGIASR